jgi:hypothetical protein
MTRPVLAIDADGVMLDLHHGVSVAWERAFGMPPREKDPHAYWPQDRWDIGPLEGEAAARFRACFDEPFWSALPALPGAIDACTRLHDAGHELVCITALRPHPPKVHTALVLRAATGSPNTGEELSLAKSIHRDLADFADHWLSREAR